MTYIIIVFTSVISFLSFSNRKMFSVLQFNAYQIYHRKEIYRLLTHGFVHAGWSHLIVNMIVLFFFGRNVEFYLSELEVHGIIKYHKLIFVVFYLLALILSSTISLVKQKDNVWYNAVGASGAVSAVLFFTIFFNPWQRIEVYFMIPIPGIIFGILYLIYSQYMSRKGNDNIAHEAHLLGAVFGFVFPLFLDLKLIYHFISQLLSAF